MIQEVIQRMLYEDDPQMLNTSKAPKHFVDFVTITASG